MNDNNFYNNTGMFTSCKKYYDKDTDKMKDATTTEVFKCCLEKCKPPVEYCKKFCLTKTKEHVNPISTCLNKCLIHEKFCTENCKLSSEYTLPMKNLYKKCLQNICKNNDYKECIKNNKDKIMKCCINNCTPEKNLNCGKFCNYFQDFFQKENSELAKEINILENEKKPDKPKKKIFLLFLIPPIFLVAFLLMCLKSI